MSSSRGVNFIAQRIAACLVLTLITGVFLLAANMQANARPDVRKMTCSQAQSLVKSSGAIVLTFTQYTYDRVVKDERYCDIGYNELEDLIVKTQDENQCLVGSICVVPVDDDEDGWYMLGR